MDHRERIATGPYRERRPLKQLSFLEAFAVQHDLLYQRDGMADRYVYSRDLGYRYAFARYWNEEGSLILWVGVNPAKGDTEKRRRPNIGDETEEVARGRVSRMEAHRVTLTAWFIRIVADCFER